MTTERRIRLPYSPRPQQQAINDALAAKRFVVAVCHRRMGKTVGAVIQLIGSALSCRRDRPRYAYIAPTYRQGKATTLDYLQHFTVAIPESSLNLTELRADYANGGQVRIYGADNPDSLRGLYLDGAVFDEYGMQPPNIFSEVVRPALADRQGWALFLGTPNGKNQFYDAAQMAQRDPGWQYLEFKASQTGLIPADELAAARAVMTQDEFDQEFECSWSAAVRGSIYAAEMQRARTEGRITNVPYDPVLPVDTDWDLGVGDATSIWFSQSLRSGEVRFIDYYEASGEGLPHYVDVLRSRGYTYGTHWAPHDIQVRELASGRSKLEAAQSLGLRFKVCPNVGLEDGIHAARMLMPRCWFDAVKCHAGLEALAHYRRDYNSRLNEFKPTPLHDWSSHGSDAYRYLAVRQQPPKPVVAERDPFDRGADWAHSDVGWMQ